MPVLLIGTLDTKGVEFQFVRDLLHQAGVATLVVDAGVLGPPHFAPDVPRERVYAAAGTTLEAIRQAGDRGQAIKAAAEGAARLATLYARDVEGALGLGGSAGTTIGTAAMRALPFGIPKLMVSTLASGQVRQYVGVRDILMMHSVVDISGLNRISRTVLANAARAMIGMVTRAEGAPAPGAMTCGTPLSAAAVSRSRPADSTPPTRSSASSVVVRSSTPAIRPSRMNDSMVIPPVPVAWKTSTS